MSITEEQKWHWSEGNKYAVEGGKSLLLINGAAAVSILTFVGNSHGAKKLIVIAMIIFAIGAMFSAWVFFLGYFTQLQYGNDDPGWAIKWHAVTYLIIFLSFICFFAGIITAGCGFL